MSCHQPEQAPSPPPAVPELRKLLAVAGREASAVVVVAVAGASAVAAAAVAVAAVVAVAAA